MHWKTLYIWSRYAERYNIFHFTAGWRLLLPNCLWPPMLTFDVDSGNPNSSCNCDCGVPLVDTEPFPGAKGGTLKWRLCPMSLRTTWLLWKGKWCQTFLFLFMQQQCLTAAWTRTYWPQKAKNVKMTMFWWYKLLQCSIFCSGGRHGAIKWIQHNQSSRVHGQTRGQKNSQNPLSIRNQIHYSKHFYNFPVRMFMQNTTPHTYSNTVWNLPEIGIVHTYTVHLVLLLNGMLKSFRVREGPAPYMGAQI